MNYVYVYKDNKNNPFYVGVGSGYRAWAHLKPSSYMPYDAEYPSFYGRIKKMKLTGIEPKVEKIFEGDRESCENLESELIQKYGLITEGGILYNITKNTGGRVPGKKYPMSDSTKERYKKTRRENRVYKIEKDELEKLYIVEGKTRKEIASLYGCSEVLIKNRLKEYKIRKMK